MRPKTKVKIKVNQFQTREIQRIIFKNGGTWASENNSKIKTSDVLYILNGVKLSWETNILEYSKEYEEVDADAYIAEHTEFPIYKKSTDCGYTVKFSDIKVGEIVKSRNAAFKVGYRSNIWTEFYKNNWQDVSEDEIAEFTEIKETVEDTTEELKFEQGEKVIATRFTESGEDLTWIGIYYGYHDGIHLIDKGVVSIKIANKVEKIKYYTKDEAKIKIEQLFEDHLDYSDRIEKIKECIDLIIL